ncbi:unnamed protein product [Ranitomeya imitator]|uniref:Retinol dehydrogenase 16 n=1 Tax=Ranitomeya imitator TaxID=111125 RepID=A0ABN9M0M7_9NEOB|nr:unnamed protein product [Ranitomeya imitator]
MRRTLLPTQVAQVVQLIQDGTSMGAVVRRFAVCISLVSKGCRRYQETSQNTRRRGGNRRRAKTQQQDRYLSLVQGRTGGTLPEPCKNDIQQATNVHVSAQTSLWGVINNAGISVPTAPNEWLTKEDFSKILNVNLLGVVDVTLKMLPLIRRARGRVVNVASIAGRFTICGGAYCMSKYGVESFSDSLRREMKFFWCEVTDAKLMKDSFQKAWTQAPEEIRRSYGQQYYERYCSLVDLTLSTSSTNLSLVTDCMEHALTAVHPKTRYSAGWDAKLFYLPLSYFPAMITDFLIGAQSPKPAKSA